MTPTAVNVIKNFLKDDPNPPDSKELMALLKTISSPERAEMAKSIEPDWNPPKDKPE